jgi:hypothetical protein
MALAFVVYTLLASGEEQPWNESNNLSSAAPAKVEKGEEEEEEEKLNPEQTIEPTAAAVVIDVVDIGNASNNK